MEGDQCEVVVGICYGVESIVPCRKWNSQCQMTAPVQDRNSRTQGQGYTDVAAVGLLDYKSYYIIIKAHYKRRTFDPQISNEILGKRGPRQKRRSSER